MPKTYHQFSKELQQLNEFAPTALAGATIGTIAKAGARGLGRMAWETTKFAAGSAAKNAGADLSVIGGILQSGKKSALERIQKQREHDREVFECPRQVTTANRSVNTAKNYVTNIKKEIASFGPSPSAEDTKKIQALQSALADAQDSVQQAADYHTDIKAKCAVLIKSKSAVAAQKGVQRFETRRAHESRTELLCNDCITKRLKVMGKDPSSATDDEKQKARISCTPCKKANPVTP